jgi:hypothetical protein
MRMDYCNYRMVGSSETMIIMVMAMATVRKQFIIATSRGVSLVGVYWPPPTLCLKGCDN